VLSTTPCFPCTLISIFHPYPSESGSEQELLHLIDAIPLVPIRTGAPRKHSSIASSIFARECNSSRCCLPRAFLGRFWSSPSTTYYTDNANNGLGAPPYSLHFGRKNHASTLVLILLIFCMKSIRWLYYPTCLQMCCLLWQFVADEDGFVSLIKTTAPKDDMQSSFSYAWRCHRNSIFDVSITGCFIRLTQIHMCTCLLPLFD
jgi:hypothetical protein